MKQEMVEKIVNQLITSIQVHVMDNLLSQDPQNNAQNKQRLIVIVMVNKRVKEKRVSLRITRKLAWLGNGKCTRRIQSAPPRTTTTGGRTNPKKEKQKTKQMR